MTKASPRKSSAHRRPQPIPAKPKPERPAFHYLAGSLLDLDVPASKLERPSILGQIMHRILVEGGPRGIPSSSYLMQSSRMSGAWRKR